MKVAALLPGSGIGLFTEACDSENAPPVSIAFITGATSVSVTYTLIDENGAPVYGGPIVRPPSNNPLFSIQGKYQHIYVNAVYYNAAGDVIAVANTDGTCDVTPGATWTPATRSATCSDASRIWLCGG